ncbi:MAG: type II toxin-antitoxin system RelE/ParE family toxin [Acidobacteriaceae bacterium]
MKRTVVYSRRAEADFVSIYRYIAEKSGYEQAMAYTTRIRAFCSSLETFPERGESWKHIASGLRVVGFERRISIAFRVAKDQVTIVRVLYGGRDLRRALQQVSN